MRSSLPMAMTTMLAASLQAEVPLIMAIPTSA
jgi:hypothetical protein